MGTITVMDMKSWQSKRAAGAMARQDDEMRNDSSEFARLTDRRALMTGVVTLPALAACSPTVRLEAPKEPIEINLNVRIQQEVRIRIDRELDDLFEEKDDIF